MNTLVNMCHDLIKWENGTERIFTQDACTTPFSTILANWALLCYMQHQSLQYVSEQTWQNCKINVLSVFLISSKSIRHTNYNHHPKEFGPNMNVPANAPFERSSRSRRAKKSLFSKRYLRDPNICKIRAREGQRMHESTLLSFVRVSLTLRRHCTRWYK